MSPSMQDSKRELAEDAEENTSNAGEGNEHQAPSPQSSEVHATSDLSDSMRENTGGKLRLILMPFRILRKRYSALIRIKSEKEDEDDTDQKPRGRPSGPVAGGPKPEVKSQSESKPKPHSGR